MAQQKVVDLVVQHGTVQIVQGDPGPLAPRTPSALSPARITTPWPTLLASGTALTALGAVTLGMFPFSLVGLVLTNLLFSAGAAFVVLGLIKRWSASSQQAPAQPALRVDPRVLAERCRRVRAILRRGAGPYTFERLVHESKWTQAAMLSTLLHMKEQGEIVEDLNLDTGEWVYSPADGSEAPTAATSPMLEERRALDEQA